MKRTYKRRPFFDPRNLGKVVFSLFIVFIAYKILTPPSEDTLIVTSPNGSRTARLKTEFYFDHQPSYKIYIREPGQKHWDTLHYIPAYTNVPADAHHPVIQWSENSARLNFVIGGSSIWHQTFSE
ncbi:hypothetical protein [Pontiella agarivorans]|uniref:Uncharacterized protein n=1 Tax=Pontiella agarivorans TaxID=3038953 RepID=A0ABU5MSG5_9BACT|nr:hypothetical protein [Pontiella agarivorans]MDZ8117144.1 hypothetical protein [Pontiella agarivorans]